MESTLDIIYKRRSVRKFTDKPVEKEVFIELLKAGMAGPSAMNTRPWEFVVITEPETLAQLRKTLMYGKMVAPAVICVLGSHRSTLNKIGGLFWVEDCSAATENILLAATSLGLGTVWIGVHPIKLVEKQVKDILNLPAGVTPLNLIYLGYPAEEPEPRTQYDESRVHWGAFPKVNGRKSLEPDSAGEE